MADGRRLRWLCAVSAVLAASAAAEISSARQAALRELLVQDCGSCHGLRMTGGLGPELTPERLAGREPAALRRAILDGVPGTPMPPWRGLLTEEEADWLVELLRRGVHDE